MFGIDMDQLFGDAKKAASQGMDDLLKTGGNAALGYLEQQAINIISADQAQHTEAAQSNINAILNRPTTAGSFGAYFSNLAQSPALKAYGPYVIGVIAVVAIGAIVLTR